MPRRAKHHPKQRYRHSIESLCALVIGRSEWERLWGGVEDGQAAYDFLIHEPGHRGGRSLIVGSVVFFDYESGVPSNLKSDAVSAYDSSQLWAEQAERRRQWLADNGFDDDR